MADYNGWRNRETWLVNLWFGDYFTERGERIEPDEIEEFVNEYLNDRIKPESGFVWDLLDIGCIDWEEMAESFNSDLEANAGEEE